MPLYAGTLPPLDTLTAAVLRVKPVPGNGDLTRVAHHYVMPADRGFLVMQPHLEVLGAPQEVKALTEALFGGLVCGAEVSGKPIFEAPWGAIPTGNARSPWWSGYPIFPAEHVAMYLRWADRAAANSLPHDVDVRFFFHGAWKVDE